MINSKTSCVLFVGSDPDDEFPVCEPTAGGETEEEEQHKPEPSTSLNQHMVTTTVPDSLNKCGDF